MHDNTLLDRTGRRIPRRCLALTDRGGFSRIDYVNDDQRPAPSHFARQSPALHAAIKPMPLGNVARHVLVHALCPVHRPPALA